MSLRVHELHSELNTERSLNDALRQSQQRFFDVLMQLKEKGEIDDGVLNCLIDHNGDGVINI